MCAYYRNPPSWARGHGKRHREFFLAVNAVSHSPSLRMPCTAYRLPLCVCTAGPGGGAEAQASLRLAVSRVLFVAFQVWSCLLCAVEACSGRKFPKVASCGGCTDESRTGGRGRGCRDGLGDHLFAGGARSKGSTRPASRPNSFIRRRHHARDGAPSVYFLSQATHDGDVANVCICIGKAAVHPATAAVVVSLFVYSIDHIASQHTWFR